MKKEISENKLGLVLGILFAAFHLVWILLVASGFAKQFFDYALMLHFFNWTYSLNPFNFATAAMLLVFTFVSGYVLGWVFAWTWNIIRVK
jgi:hypothetical protein